MRVSMIAAVAENGVIGRNNDLPWRIRDDMRFFVRKTKGHAVIMGRRNWDSMDKPLGERENYVVSRSQDVFPGAHAARSVEEALALVEDSGETEAMVIGGAEIFRLAWPYAHTFYRTRVLAEVPGDVFFPRYDESDWTVEELSRGEVSERNEYPFVIEELTRRTEPQPYR